MGVGGFVRALFADLIGFYNTRYRLCSWHPVSSSIGMSSFLPDKVRFVEFDGRVVDDARVISVLAPELVEDFCRITLDFLQKGVDKKVFSKAAGSLGTSSDRVELAVTALADMFNAGTKNLVGRPEFEHSLSVLGWSEAQISVLGKFYGEHMEEIAESLQRLSMVLPQYRDLNWRLDVELASRVSHYRTDPSFVLRLDSSNPDRSFHIQADYANLKHLQTELEVAVAEMKSVHCHRISRYIR